MWPKSTIRLRILKRPDSATKSTSARGRREKLTGVDRMENLNYSFKRMVDCLIGLSRTTVLKGSVVVILLSCKGDFTSRGN